jgi:molybdopterin-containing oxidoreductase family membrane subunit
VPELTYREINDDLLRSLEKPSRRYWAAVGGLALLVAALVVAWGYQILVGMGVAGLNHPVGWGVYIVNFVFWIGIGHAGTLISAILYLLKVRWRTGVYRAAEAMTVFAVMTAGMFPLIHLGRVWVFYWIAPYFNRAHLWPNFKSPLVWDVVAVTTYLTVSVVFWYTGLIPDLAAMRDATTGRRHRIYRLLALGWQGSWEQWRHYLRGYMCLAALATPLVISVHSVVSWDFGMSLLPGWHTTLFAPYFVAGAIHSGLAMVIVLLIPARRLLRLERLIRLEHFEAMAQITIFTGLVVLYAYLIEVFSAWYSGNLFERQFALWRATGPYAWAFWLMVFCNTIVPLGFFFKRLRTSIPALLTIALLINIGMWFERFAIIVPALAHDFLPSSWGLYCPRPVEIIISVGALAFFVMMFMLFAKHLPAVAISEVKEHDVTERLRAAAAAEATP